MSVSDELFVYYERHDNHLIKAALFQDLPDLLSLSNIAFLWACDGKIDDQGPVMLAKFHIELRNALESKRLKGTHVNMPEKYLADCVSREQFKAWVLNVWLPKQKTSIFSPVNTLLAGWVDFKHEKSTSVNSFRALDVSEYIAEKFGRHVKMGTIRRYLFLRKSSGVIGKDGKMFKRNYLDS